MKRFSLKALALAAGLTVAGSASAVTLTPLNIDTGWKSFAYGAVGSLAQKTYSFTLTGHALLTIVDGYLSGDRFEVIANGVSRGLTSLAQAGQKVGNKWDKAVLNPAFSKRAYHFGPGSYVVSILVAQQVGPVSANHNAAIRLDTSAVPVPAAGFMLITALGAVAARRRRRV